MIIIIIIRKDVYGVYLSGKLCYGLSFYLKKFYEEWETNDKLTNLKIILIRYKKLRTN